MNSFNPMLLSGIRCVSYRDRLRYSFTLLCSFLVNAFGLDGMGLEALELFQRMPKSLLDKWTYVSLLNACSHAGLVDQAREIFLSIPSKTQMIYTVMVSRASLLDQAQQLIEQSESCHSPSLPMYSESASFR